MAGPCAALASACCSSSFRAVSASADLIPEWLLRGFFQQLGATKLHAAQCAGHQRARQKQGLERQGARSGIFGRVVFTVTELGVWNRGDTSSCPLGQLVRGRQRCLNLKLRAGMGWHLPEQLCLPGKQPWLHAQKPEGFPLLRERGSEEPAQRQGSPWPAEKPRSHLIPTSGAASPAAARSHSMACGLWSREARGLVSRR